MCAICFVFATCALDRIFTATTKPESRCLAIGTIPNDLVPMIGPSSKFRIGVFRCIETLFGFGSKTFPSSFSGTQRGGRGGGGLRDDDDVLFVFSQRDGEGTRMEPEALLTEVHSFLNMTTIHKSKHQSGVFDDDAEEEEEEEEEENFEDVVVVVVVVVFLDFFYFLYF